ncbi:MAG TPA: DUF1963 domain-containing protein [Thermomonospora sp.]|nr:DUF1963 domain-containing protein [Thermomonospora sp.]
MPDPAQARASAVHHLGEDLGGRLADLGEVGFALEPDTASTAGCRLGGPALLDPGTAWPEFAGVPLTLIAVLDLAAFVPLIGNELPENADGMLLNLFHCGPNTHLYDHAWGRVRDPLEWRVIPAARGRATERAAPAPAVRFRPFPVRAVPVLTFPDVDEPVVDDLLDGPRSDRFDVTAWQDRVSRYQVWAKELPGHEHQAFGWPAVVHGSPTAQGRRQRVERDPASGAAVPPDDAWRLLLRVGSDGRILTEDGERWWQWADMGALYYVIPGAALRAGDLSQAEAAEQG